MTITVLCGGVGAARFLSGLAGVHPPTDTVGIVNTGDDTVLHGLAISPDIDTITYTLAWAIDPDRGWGLHGESWRTMEALARYVPVRPAGSSAAPTWFNLGDRDLATHLYRTARLAEGASLTEVTAEICRAWGVHQRLFPMSDERVATMVTVHDEGTPPARGASVPGGLEVPFQEYFVQRRHSVPVSAVRFAGVEAARPGPGVLRAIGDADVVVVAPSNPLVSIAPIRALPGVDAALAARRGSVVAISPIVGGAALKGPADRMLAELGMEASVVGVARLYAPIAATLVIDPADAHLAAAVEAVGMRAVVSESVMSTPARAHHLASVAISSVTLP